MKYVNTLLDDSRTLYSDKVSTIIIQKWFLFLHKYSHYTHINFITVSITTCSFIKLEV